MADKRKQEARVVDLGSVTMPGGAAVTAGKAQQPPHKPQNTTQLRQERDKLREEMRRKYGPEKGDKMFADAWPGLRDRLIPKP